MTIDTTNKNLNLSTKYLKGRNIKLRLSKKITITSLNSMI